MIKTDIYDSAKGVKIYTIGNSKGMTASFMERGATMISLCTPDKNGKIENVIVQLKDYDEYVKNTCYIGVVPGRYANRIGKCKFTLDGVEYHLNANDGQNSLHGGPHGFHEKNWTVKSHEDGADGASITFEYVSPDGEENFPGTLTSSVTYTVTENNELAIHYQGTTDKATIVNLTQHAYFNLSGDFKNPAIAHYAVMINANAITEVDSESIPTGKIAPVEGTDFDFRRFRRLKTINNFWYDHNYCLNNNCDCKVLAAEVEDPESGRIMKVFTSEPGMQFYTGNFLDGTLDSAFGKKVTRQSAFCFETQHYPDAPNNPTFASTELRPGQIYTHKAVFKFEVENESDKKFFPEL